MKTFMMPAPPKAHERKMAEALSEMVELMARIFRNQVILELKQSTVKQFEDAKPETNYAAVYMKIANRITGKLIKRFDEKRLYNLNEQIINAADRTNKSVLYNAFSRVAGLDPKQIIKEESGRALTDAIIEETAQWALKLRDDALQSFTNRTLRAMSQGLSIDEIIKEFDGEIPKRKNHAKFLARTQIANYNALISKNRAQNLGITEAVWVGHDDGRERESHIWRNGKRFKLSEGLYSPLDKKFLIPGVDYQCRCRARYILPDE